MFAMVTFTWLNHVHPLVDAFVFVVFIVIAHIYIFMGLGLDS